MKTIRAIILCCVLATFVSCTPRGIIPKRKLAAINADMYLFDQYAGADNKMKRFSDTCAVYKPLLRSYGYTSDQYFASIDYYLQNMKDMEDVLDMTDKILKKREKKILKHIDAGARKADTTVLKKNLRKPKKDTVDNNQ